MLILKLYISPTLSKVHIDTLHGCDFCSAVEILTRVMKDGDLSEIFKTLQLHLQHNLPLGAYLLKPVQRILKYHLLLHVSVRALSVCHLCVVSQ